MFTLSLFTSLRFKGFNQRSLDGRLMLTIACPFSSLRLLEENTREPISGEKTRAQQSPHGRREESSLLRHHRQTPGRAICRWRKRPLKRALKLALRMSQHPIQSGNSFES